MTETAYETDYVDWATFIDGFDWSQGEHVSLIGPTGHGKTTTAGHLLDNPPHGQFKPHSRHWYWKLAPWAGLPKLGVDVPRPYVVVLANKRRDEVAERFMGRGYIRMTEWKDVTPQFSPDVYPRRVLWPPSTKLGKASSQKEVFAKALDKIAEEEGWAVYVDDAIYVVDQEMLRLRPEYRDSLYRLRASGITIISGIQRPSGIPREGYSQVRHLFFWHTNDESDLDRIQGVGGLSGKRVRATVQRLADHEALYINTLSEYMVRTQSPR